MGCLSKITSLLAALLAVAALVAVSAGDECLLPGGKADLAACGVASGGGASASRFASCGRVLKEAPNLLQTKFSRPPHIRTAHGKEGDLNALVAFEGPCEDDPNYRDSWWHSDCHVWSDWECKGFDFSAALEAACPVACGMCDPAATTPAPSTTTTHQAEAGPCEEWMLQELSDLCFETALAEPTCQTFEANDCKIQWEGLNNLILLGDCKVESGAISSDLLKHHVGGQRLFEVIEELGSKYGAECRSRGTAMPPKFDPVPIACEDSPEYRDPTWGDDCAKWAHWPCDGYTFTGALQGACPKSCGVCGA